MTLVSYVGAEVERNIAEFILRINETLCECASESSFGAYLIATVVNTTLQI